MKYIIKLEKDEILKVLVSLLNEADRLEELAIELPEDQTSRTFALRAKKTKKLYRKILDTYETMD